MTSSSILISGVGRIGKALAKIIAPAHQREIALWDTDSSKIDHSFSATQLAASADVIFLCMPASAVREYIASIKTQLKPTALVVSLIKGLDPTTGATMAELLQEILPPTIKPIQLGGPILSGELLAGRAAYGLAGCQPQVFPAIAELFAPTLLRVSHSDDVLGVSAAGVLKNIYALGLGIASALNVGDNALGKLTVQAIQEMQPLVTQLGGKAETVSSLAGLGDLVATGFSPHSRNRSVGVALVHGTPVTTPSEGMLALPLLIKRLGDISPYDFLAAVAAVVEQRTTAAVAYQELLGA